MLAVAESVQCLVATCLSLDQYHSPHVPTWPLFGKLQGQAHFLQKEFSSQVKLLYHQRCISSVYRATFIALFVSVNFRIKKVV